MTNILTSTLRGRTAFALALVCRHARRTVHLPVAAITDALSTVRQCQSTIVLGLGIATVFALATSRDGTLVATLAATPAPQSCTPLPSGLTHWWPGEGGSSDVIAGDNGTVVGSVTYSPGLIGQAFQFGSGHIRLSQTYGGPSTAEVTVMAWIQVQQSGPEAWQAIFSSTTGTFLHFQTSTIGGSAVYTTGSPAFHQLPSFGPSPFGTWRHVALTAKSGELRVYENGVVVSQSGSPFPYITQRDDAVLIGAGYQNARPFPGLIDELQVYGRSLTQSEIEAVFDCWRRRLLPSAPWFLERVGTTDSSARTSRRDPRRTRLLHRRCVPLPTTSQA